jgi:hypothetical protein
MADASLRRAKNGRLSNAFAAGAGTARMRCRAKVFRDRAII